MALKIIRRCSLQFVIFMIIGAAMQSVSDFAQTTVPSEIQTTVLACGYGGVGIRPVPLPPDFDTEFAIVVLEIQSSRTIPNVTVSEFSILSKDGSETGMKHVVRVDEVVDTPSNNEKASDYYIFNGETRPWNGTLPAGRIRLRIRVALERGPIAPTLFRLRLGTEVIEGKVGGAWPT
jgi:hypothetical protein